MTGEDVVRLNVRRRKREFNRQVFQHLVAWREFLSDGGELIRFETGGPEIGVDKRFLCQTVPFGVYGDSRNITAGAEELEVPWEATPDDDRMDDDQDDEDTDDTAEEAPEEAREDSEAGDEADEGPDEDANSGFGEVEPDEDD